MLQVSSSHSDCLPSAKLDPSTREAVHRVEKNDSAHKYVITKGDNNSSEDPAPVSMEEIGGKVVMKFNAVAPLVRMIKHLDNL